MTDRPEGPEIWQRSARAARHNRRRHRAEWRFRVYGLSAVILALAVLGALLGSITVKGHSAFVLTHVELEVFYDPAILDPDGTGNSAIIGNANFAKLIKQSLVSVFPDVTKRNDKRALAKLVSQAARFELRGRVLEDPSLIGTHQTVSLAASGDLDMFVKGHIPRDVPESDRRLSDKQIGWIDALDASSAIETRFNIGFFTNGDSRDPEMAGIWGAVVGSFYTLLITLVLAFPIGVTTAIYLEEFAPKNRWTDLIEVNINNLAAVPSIIFGLLGLAIFLQLFHLPRSAPIVGGLTLMIMTLPTIIIATRAAIQAVPPSIREAAHGLGASPLQVVLHHVLPLAMPGILTGTIIGMARALGETAPLLMIGMVAFIVDVPGGPFDPSTVMPVQIFLWADRPERAFLEKTSAAILVLLVFLILMNALAVYLRKRFEKRW